MCGKVGRRHKRQQVCCVAAAWRVVERYASISILPSGDCTRLRARQRVTLSVFSAHQIGLHLEDVHALVQVEMVQEVQHHLQSQSSCP